MLCRIHVMRLTGEIAGAREDYEVCDFSVSTRKFMAAHMLDIHIHEGIKRIASVCLPALTGNSKQRRQQLRKAIRQVEEIIHGTC